MSRGTSLAEMPSESAVRLASRASAHRLEIPAELSDQLLAYYELLIHWNRKINLTALSDPDAAIDRLLLEPFAAAALLPKAGTLMDLGSGGGSPAIPLALALKSPQLVMVESRSRKAAFLREAAREVGLSAVVEAVRFEELHESAYRGSMDLVSIRAVRMDAPALLAAAAFAKTLGRVAMFASAGQPPTDILRTLTVDRTSPLIGQSVLIELVPV